MAAGNGSNGNGGSHHPHTDVIPLSRFHALLGRARGAKRMEALLSRPDAEAAVTEMPVQDLYYLIREVGLTDAHALVELASPEQVQGFQKEMDAAGADWQFVNFAGAVHCFAEPDANRPPNCLYNEKAANRAYGMMRGFLAERFGS